METPDRWGPSITARWEHHQVGDPPAQTEILALADARNDASSQPPLYYCIPPAPRLARTPAGDPQLSLTVLVSRMPEPDDLSFEDLVEGGMFGLTLSLTLPEIATLARYEPLACTSASFSLAKDDKALITTEGAGARPRGALSGTLAREPALSILRALQKQPSGLEVRSTIRFLCAAAPLRVRLDGFWAEVYDVLREYSDPDGVLTPAEVRTAFDAMLDRKVIRVQTSGAADLPRELAYETFFSLRFVILAGSGPNYVLRKRPYSVMRLELEKSSTAPATRQVQVHAPLEDVIGGAAGPDVRKFVQFVVRERTTG